MNKKGGSHKKQSYLWLARKRRGLVQKQVAFMMGKTVDEISRYERGARIPELPTLIGLEIIYGTPLRMLFKDLYEQVLTEIREKVKSRTGLSSLYPELLSEDGSNEWCSYEGLINSAGKSDIERLKVRDHVTRLAKKMAGL
jgi:transcriptional regulator with XRE-family HTH domain